MRQAVARRLPPALRVPLSILRHPANGGRRVRRLLAAVGFQIWKRTVGRPIEIELLNGMRFMAHRRCDCSSEAVYYGCTSSREAAFLRDCLDGGTLIDIGANVGLFTLSLADLVDDALLFEPNPVAAERARENLRLNDLPARVQELALSDREGRLFLENRGEVDTTNRTLNSDDASPFPCLEVTASSLDRTLEQRPIEGRICLIKVDVEGHEQAVIRGMMQTLRTRRPEMVMFEYLQRTNLDAVEGLFDDAGYRLRRLDERSRLVDLDDRPAPGQDLFALPRAKITTSTMGC